MLSHWVDLWVSLYANSPVLRTGLGFAHVAGLVVSGGSAIAVDRATLVACRGGGVERAAHLHVLHGTHRGVVIGLTVVILSGLLLLAADLETYLYSWVFWTKMGTIALLVANGGLLVRAGQQAMRGNDRAWQLLRTGSVASLALWLLTTLMGAALPNV